MAAGEAEKERTLEETATWAVAVVCFLLLAISIFIEHIIHAIGKWFKKKRKIALYEALGKVKGELMLMGFISFMLTMLQSWISTICISREMASTWRPCASYKDEPTKEADKDGDNSRKLLEYSQRRFLATKGYDQCGEVVVGISPIIWVFAVLGLLTNTHGWFPYYWLPFIPLIIILVVGAKLEMIITQMGLRIVERLEVVKGAPVVEPGDDLFWFKSPRFLLNLIHFVIFQNAFQLAFFAYTSYAFGIRSCFHREIQNIVIRLATGIVIQVLCSYVTLPLYALVIQMGSTMRPTIFNERVAAALKNWHQTARKQVKDYSKHTGPNTPLSSYPATPTHAMSPVHLLQKHAGARSDSTTGLDNNEQWDVEEGSTIPAMDGHEIQMIPTSSSSPTELPPIRTQQHDNEIHQSNEFSFEISHRARDHRRSY